MPLRLEWRSESDWIVCGPGEQVPLRLVVDTRGLQPPPERVIVEGAPPPGEHQLVSAADGATASTDVIWLDGPWLLPKRYCAVVHVSAAPAIKHRRQFWIIPRPSPLLGAFVLVLSAAAIIYYMGFVLRTLHFTLTDLGLGLSGVTMLTCLAWARTLATRARAPGAPPHFGVGLMWPRTLLACVLLLALTWVIGEYCLARLLVTVHNATDAKAELKHSFYGHIDLPAHREITLTRIGAAGVPLVDERRFRSFRPAFSDDIPSAWHQAQTEIWTVECLPKRWPLDRVPLSQHHSLSPCGGSYAGLLAVLPHNVGGALDRVGIRVTEPREWCINPGRSCELSGTIPWVLLPESTASDERLFRVTRYGDVVAPAVASRRIWFTATPRASEQTAVPADCPECRLRLSSSVDGGARFEAELPSRAGDRILELGVHAGEPRAIDAEAKHIGRLEGTVACIADDGDGGGSLALVSVDWIDRSNVLAGLRVTKDERPSSSRPAAARGAEHSSWRFSVRAVDEGRGWVCLPPAGGQLELILRSTSASVLASVTVAVGAANLEQIAIAEAAGPEQGALGRTLAQATCTPPPVPCAATSIPVRRLIAVSRRDAASTDALKISKFTTLDRAPTEWHSAVGDRETPMFLCTGACIPSAKKSSDNEKAPDPKTSTKTVALTTDRRSRSGRLELTTIAGFVTAAKLTVEPNICDRRGERIVPSGKCTPVPLDELRAAHPRKNCDVVMECTK